MKTNEPEIHIFTQEEFSNDFISFTDPSDLDKYKNVEFVLINLENLKADLIQHGIPFEIITN